MDEYNSFFVVSALRSDFERDDFFIAFKDFFPLYSLSQNIKNEYEGKGFTISEIKFQTPLPFSSYGSTPLSIPKSKIFPIKIDIYILFCKPQIINGEFKTCSSLKKLPLGYDFRHLRRKAVYEIGERVSTNPLNMMCMCVCIKGVYYI